MTEEAKLSTRATRKLRRRIENDQLAEQAQFWDRPRSAEQKGYDKPINRQAAKELRPPRRARKSGGRKGTQGCGKN
jgi:hypothetical protein